MIVPDPVFLFAKATFQSVIISLADNFSSTVLNECPSPKCFTVRQGGVRRDAKHGLQLTVYIAAYLLTEGEPRPVKLLA